MEKCDPCKYPQYFFCDNCHFKCSKKSNYDKHLTTNKHQNGILLNKKAVKPIKNAADKFCCKYCNKEYKARNSLWYHEKKCNFSEEKSKVTEENIILVTEEKEEKHEENNKNENMNILINLFQEQLKENKELKELIIEQQKKIMEISAGTNITNNTTNNKFNLNIFLNEKCKDAFNITDFINSIDVSFKDFENFGKIGYVGSINNILIRELKGIDVYKRPFHCSDLKREIIHVKDNDTWVKDEDKKHMKRAIKLIEHKNIKLVPGWLKANPKADDISTKKHEEYMKILDNSMGEMKDEDNERNYEKIIRNVAKEILIDKDK
jgi:hypothetical protein